MDGRNVGVVLYSLTVSLFAVTLVSVQSGTPTNSAGAAVRSIASVSSVVAALSRADVPLALGSSSGVVLGRALDPSTTIVLQSVNRDLIDNLYGQLLYVALPLTLFVLVILVYAVVRFRDNDDPKPTAEDPPLEITWTAATAIILLFVGVSSYAVLANPYLSPGIQSDEGFGGTGGSPIDVPEDDDVVEVTAYQWEWQFTYEQADVTTRNELVIPADEDVTLLLTSRDVIHSLAIPDLGVRQDVFPEEETAVRTNVHQTGEYRAECTEFCGARHAHMQANVTVVDAATYEEWLDEHEGEDGVTEAPNADE